MRNTTRLFRRAALLLALCLLLSGCGASNDLSALFNRSDITGLTISYMAYTGDDIPTTELSAADAAFTTILDALFTANTVKLDLSQAESYSPEMNASQILYLHTGAGSMPVYVDSYHVIFSVPMFRSEGEENIRTYMIFQPEEAASSPLWETITSLEPLRPDPQTVLNTEDQAEGGNMQYGSPDLSGFTPPDDSEARAAVSEETLSAAGETITFEIASSDYQPAAALYYAFDASSLSGVPAGKAYVVACPAAEEGLQASIGSITRSEGTMLVRVQFTEGAEAAGQNAAYIDQSVLSACSTVVFIKDDDQSVLYVQQYAAPESLG